MKVAYLGVLLSASFLELTSHEDEARAVQCVLTYPETNKIILKSVSVCLTKRRKLVPGLVKQLSEKAQTH